MNTKEVCSALVLGIRDYFKKNNFSKAVIGLSGGIDSSVAAFLAVKAIGKKNVAGILMPDLKVTSKESIDDGLLAAKKLGISHHIVPINESVQYFENIGRGFKIKPSSYALANAKARARMMILYYFANLDDSLVIGTSDKSEIALGYTTKHGDNASDILVLGDLWKTEVISLGKYLGVPGKILKKKPSAELVLGQSTEKELGAPYEVLDKILSMYIECGLSAKEIVLKGFDKKTVKNTAFRIRINEHKRRAAVLIRVSEKSFHGMEWRMPITNKFNE